MFLTNTNFKLNKQNGNLNERQVDFLIKQLLYYLN